MDSRGPEYSYPVIDMCMTCTHTNNHLQLTHRFREAMIRLEIA